MPAVDRQATTPFLVRIFCSHGNFHRIDDFRAHSQPKNEINIYSWKDATLGELTTLLAKELIGDSDKPISGFKFSYRLIYGDNGRGNYLSRDIGTVQTTQGSRESQKTLDDARFVIGDWVNIAVLQPGDRLYDSKTDDRESRNPANSHGRGNYRGGSYGRGYNARDSNSGGNGTNYRPYERYERNSQRPSESRWGNNAYRGRR